VRYVSTRATDHTTRAFSDILLEGLAPDGGLAVLYGNIAQNHHCHGRIFQQGSPRFLTFRQLFERLFVFYHHKMPRPPVFGRGRNKGGIQHHAQLIGIYFLMGKLAATTPAVHQVGKTSHRYLLLILSC